MQLMWWFGLPPCLVSSSCSSSGWSTLPSRWGAPPGTPSRGTSTRSTASTTRKRRGRMKTLVPRASTNSMTIWAKTFEESLKATYSHTANFYLVPWNSRPIRTIFKTTPKLVVVLNLCKHSYVFSRKQIAISLGIRPLLKNCLSLLCVLLFYFRMLQ